MKNAITRTLIILLLSLTKTTWAQSFQPYKSGVIFYRGYSFPIVPGTEAWKNINHPQKVASLQLPMDTLRNMSTTRLLETCIYYPFNIDIIAFDDQFEGFGNIKDQFNGYSELYQRQDFVEQLIRFYYTRNVSFVDQLPLDYDKGLFAFDFKIMEFMFADAACMASYDQAELIVKLLLEKKHQKAQNQVYGSTNNIAMGLAIGRCLQLFSSSFSDYRGTTLNAFLQSGKLTDPSDLDYIFNKAKIL